MPRLALATSVEVPSGAETVTTPLASRIGTTVLRRFGETVLLYRLIPGFAIFHTRARPVGLVRGMTPVELQCQFDQVVAFSTKLPRVEPASVPGVRRMLLLDDADFEAILVAGMGTSTSGFLESAPLEFYGKVHDEVLRRWDHACAITGEKGDPASRLSLEVVEIQPRASGGPLDASNYLPMIPAAAAAWREGVISADENLEIVAVLPRLKSSLLRRIPSGWRLRVPADPQLWPSLEYLAFHRTQIFGH